MTLWLRALLLLLPPLGDGSRPESATGNLSIRFLHRGGSERKREAALRESIKRIKHWNSLSFGDNITALYGINQFSHLFPEEFKAIYLQSRPSKVPRYVPQVTLQGADLPLPAKFDWRDKNVVTEVRNQGECGACWAFSVVSGIESAYAIKGNVLEKLSVQQVIDCSYNNYGCNGGSTVSALSWLNQTYVKLVRDSKYLFKAHTGLCHYFRRSDFGISITDYVAYDLRTVTDDKAEWFLSAGKYVGNTIFLKSGQSMTSTQEDEMMKMLIKWGPLAVIVDALSWQDYLGGIIQHHCSSGEPNHAVVVTGFDRTGSIPYWIVRNSWGNTWGINGYAHVKMGSNICGIADSVSAVFV